MKENPKINLKTMINLSTRIADLLYSRIQNDENDFIRESELYMLFGVFDDIELNKESINEIFFYINDIFNFSPPMMKYKYVDVINPKYFRHKERAFTFAYGSSLEELASIVNAIHSENKIKQDSQIITYEHINCLVENVVYKDIFIISKLKSQIPFTENNRFLFNSFFTNLKRGDIIHLLERDFSLLEIGNEGFLYNPKELSEYELSTLKENLSV